MEKKKTSFWRNVTASFVAGTIFYFLTGFIFGQTIIWIIGLILFIPFIFYIARSVPVLRDFSIFSQREDDIYKRPPPALEPYLWPKPLPPITDTQPEWFRPKGLAEVDIKAGFFPVRTVARIRQKIEEIWQQQTIPVLEAPPASGKTSILRVLTTHWQNQNSYMFFIPAVYWSEDIAENLLAFARFQIVTLIIDDLHRRNEHDLGLLYFLDVLQNPNVKCLLATRPRQSLKELLDDIQSEIVKIPFIYPRELVNRFLTISGSDLPKDFDPVELLRTHKHNIASLVYEFRNDSSQSYHQFWRQFVMKKCREFAISEKTHTDRWVALLLILSFLRTREISCTPTELSLFIKPDLDLPLTDIKRMIFVLEEHGLLVKEFSFKDDESSFSFSYHAEFCIMLLKENLEDFQRLVKRRVPIADRRRYSKLELSLWAWWIETLAPNMHQLVSIRRNLGPLWKKLTLSPKLWKKWISDNPDLLGVQIALLTYENDSLKGYFARWMSRNHWIAWLLNKRPDERVGVIERWLTCTDRKNVTDCLIKLDSSLLDNIEWKEDLGSVDDPGGGDFEPGSAHLGFHHQGYDYVKMLARLFGDQWLRLCARYLSLCLEKNKLVNFEEFLDRIGPQTLKSLPVELLPDASTIATALDPYTISSSLINNLSLWSGPKPHEIALYSFLIFLNELENDNRSKDEILWKENKAEDWIDAMEEIPESTLKIIENQFIEAIQSRSLSNLLRTEEVEEKAILLRFLAEWAPGYLEEKLTPELIVDLSPLLIKYPQFQSILLQQIHLLPALILKEWLRKNVLIAKDFPEGLLEALLKQTFDTKWFIILEKCWMIISNPIFYDGAEWNTVSEAQEKKKLANEIYPELLSVMNHIPASAWRDCFVKELIKMIQGVPSKSPQSLSLEAKEVIQRIFIGEKLLKITIFETWDQLHAILKELLASQAQSFLISEFLEYHPSFVSTFTQELLREPPRISREVLFESFSKLEKKVVTKTLPQFFRKGISYSQLRSFSGKRSPHFLSPKTLPNLVSLQENSEQFLDEFLPEFLRESLRTASEILYWLTKDPYLESLTIPIIQSKVNAQFALRIVKAASIRQQLELLEFFDKVGISVLENLDKDYLADLIIEEPYQAGLWLLQNPIIDSEVVKGVFHRIADDETKNDLLEDLTRHLRRWIEARRDPKIFVNGVSEYLTPELMDQKWFSFHSKDALGHLVDCSSVLATAALNQTKFWLTDADFPWNDIVFEVICKVWGHPEALKKEMARWDENDQSFALQRLIELEIDESHKDWTINLFPRNVRVNLYQEMIQWMLFDQDEKALGSIIKLVSLDPVIVEACGSIPKDDWKMSVLGGGDAFFCYLLEMLAHLSQISRSKIFLDIGQSILDEEKQPNLIRAVITEMTGSQKKGYNFQVALKNLQTHPENLLRLYHDILDIQGNQEIKEKINAILKSISLEKLSWKQIAHFLLSLPKNYSSDLVKCLQQHLEAFLEAITIEDVFSLHAILALHQDERKRLYKQISTEFLSSINWWNVDSDIGHSHCDDRLTDYDDPELFYDYDISHYNFDSREDDNFCAICKLSLRKTLVTEIWEDLVIFMPEKAEEATNNLPIYFLFEFYDESKPLRSWIEQIEALRVRMFTNLSGSQDLPFYTKNEIDDPIRISSHHKNLFILLFKSPFANEFWQLLQKNNFATFKQVLAEYFTVDELHSFLLNELTRIDNSGIFLAELLSTSSDVSTRSYWSPDDQRAKNEILQKAWKSELTKTLSFLEKFRLVWPNWFPHFLGMITPNLVYESCRGDQEILMETIYNVVWWLTQNDWPYAKEYADLLIFYTNVSRLSSRGLSKEEKAFIDHFRPNEEDILKEV